MKKLLLSAAALAATAAANADTYPYLSFTTTDGATVSVAVESLSMTFGDSGETLTLSNATGSRTLRTADLAKMFFSANDATGISEVTTGKDAGQMQVFTLSGTLVGQFGSTRSLDEAVEPGIYLVRKNGRTQKIAVR